MTYFITIKNATGETLVDKEVDAVLVSYADQKTCGGNYYGGKNPNANDQAFFVAKEIIDTAKKEFPHLPKYNFY